MVTIYALKDPDTNDVRYIGQSRNVYSRYGAHINASRKGAPVNMNGAYQEWMDDLRKRCKEPVLEVLEVVEEKHANETERLQIQKHWPNGQLVNATSGAKAEPPTAELYEKFRCKAEWSDKFWTVMGEIQKQYGDNWIAQATTELVLGNRNYANLSDEERLRLDVLEIWHRYVVMQPQYMMGYLYCPIMKIPPMMPREDLSKAIPLEFSHFQEDTKEVMNNAKRLD
jgi:hypothetical protein